MTWTLEYLRAALHGGPPLLAGMADATMKATALLLAAGLATLLVRRASAASRHFVWSLAAPGPLALPWAAGVALAFLKILAGRIGVRLLSRRASPVTDLDALAVLSRLRRRMGIRRPVMLLQADRATLPMTWGTLQPVVLLPADAY